MSMTVYLEGKKISNVKKGSLIQDLVPLFGTNHTSPIIAAKLDNEIVQLSQLVTDGCDLSLIDLDSSEGVTIYKRSLQFLLMLALHKIVPDCKLKVGYSVNNGVYCDLNCKQSLNADKIAEIEREMHRLVSLEIPVTKIEVTKEKAIELLKVNNRDDRILILEYLGDDKVIFYQCGDYHDYFFSCLVSNTRYLKVFSLQYHEGGLVIVHPVRYDSTHVAVHRPSEKLFRVFSEFKSWGEILEINSVGQLNQLAKNGEINDMILVCEALQSKKIAHIADEIAAGKKRLVLISGPSSSGKTTFSKRLAIALRVNGIKAYPISLDNYYKDQSEAPIGPDGELDLEHIETLDLALLNDQLIDILNNKKVKLPHFNFHTKKRDSFGQMFQAEEHTVIIMEGIHGLNDDLTKKIPNDLKYKIYVSALATINVDDHVRISTTDNRLLRRMVRDNQYRNTEAKETLQRWKSVRAGEKRWIFPYQEEADIMFNSALYYEFSVLKAFAEPLLFNIDNAFPQFSTVKRLMNLLDYFHPVDANRLIPNNSILREFIGDSCFRTVTESENKKIDT